MGQPVMVRSGIGSWRQPEVTAYGNERELQALVAASPDLLTGVPMATVDEFWVPGIGSVDILGVGADGSITIVECKLRANPEIRREVIGQVMAYAGGLWKMPYDEFVSGWQARSNGRALLDTVVDATEQGIEAEDFRQTVTQHLNDGDFTLIIAVDEITTELKRAVEFLNVATRDEVTVLAMELQYLKDGGLEILIPRTYGVPLGEAKGRTTGSALKWDAESFGRELATLPDGQREALERLLDHGARHGHHPWYGQGKRPGMSYYYRVAGQPVSLFQIYLWPSGNNVTACVGAVNSAKHLGSAQAMEYLGGLRAIPEIAPHVAHLDQDSLNKYPTIPVTGVLDDPTVVDRFLAVLDALRGSSAGPVVEPGA